MKTNVLKKSTKAAIAVFTVALILFVAWTMTVKTYDVAAVGPEGTSVGYSTMNVAFHELTGVNLTLYSVIDIVELASFAFVAAFAALGVVQLIKRKSLFKVDHDIILLGVFYVVVLAVFFLFEKVVINYRPVLIEGKLEPSYPSSTTMLVLCVIPTAIMQMSRRLKNKALKATAFTLMILYAAAITVGRAVCGVHWLTDIIGAILLSLTLCAGYFGAVGIVGDAKAAKE